MRLLEIPTEISKYAEMHSGTEDPLLEELHRQTHLKTVHPQMISGPLQGALLQMISTMVRPHRILEIGTFTGYATICLSRGLAEGGKMTTIEVNDEVEEICRKYFEKAGIADRIDLVIGNALEMVPQLRETFDLVFIDGNKEHYPRYYAQCLEKTRPGGYLLIDNVLWGGKVIGESLGKDRSAQIIDLLNKDIHNDPRVENVLVPVRDGLMVVRKK